MVKDSTLDASILAMWSTMIGGGVASFVCWILFVAMGDSYEWSYNIAILFVLAFTFQYIEFNAMGKKVGLCIFAILLLQRTKPDMNECWRIFLDLLFGSICGLAGNLLPWPFLASYVVEERARFVSEV